MSRSADIAARIHAHLQRMEADLTGYNAEREVGGMTLRPLYVARAVALSGRIHVVYVDYQRGTTLTLAEAEAYLAWLDAGNQGKHFEALRRS